MKLRTVSTEEVAVTTKVKQVKFDKATLVKPEVTANNGILQVVDAVVLPAPSPPAKK